MKIILSNNAAFEITDEIITIEEFLALADKLRELAITSRTFEQQPQFIPQPQPQPVEPEPEQEEVSTPTDLSEIPIEDRIYRLKKEGNQLSQIAKAFNITSSQARRLYQRVYQREYMRKHQKAKKGKKVRVRAPTSSRWTDRNEVLDAIKVHYFGTEADKERLSQKKGKSWKDIVKSFWNLTKRYDIKPAELGLKKWGKERRGFSQPQPQQQLQPQQVAQTVQFQDDVISVAERQFIDFFTNYIKKGGSEPELKQAVLLLREWLKSQGKSGNSREVLEFLGTKVKSLRPIVSPEKLEEWFK